MAKKVFVSGCFDLLHSGHAAFLKTAAAFGDVYVGAARDETILQLKGRAPANTEAERLFMLRSLRYVKEARLSSGIGRMDFAEDLHRLRPDLFIVNEDGHAPEKEALCAGLGIEYRVLRREPEPGLPARSTSALRACAPLPYRAELCGAWLDQPFVNRLAPGWVICAQLADQPAFEQPGGGLAGSTRACLNQLSSAGLPPLEPEALARLAFRYENGIDQENHPVSGAQDALGLCMPGVSFQYYDGGYWPREMESLTDPETLQWIERHLSLYLLRPRLAEYDPLQGAELQTGAAQGLAMASARCKHAIEHRCLPELAESFAQCRQAQQALFPAMFPADISVEMERLRAAGRCLEWKFTGAGGGGWMVLVGAQELLSAVPLRFAGCNSGRNMV